MFTGQKLLVADDSPYYRTVIGLTFTDEGMEVTTAGDGREALEKLEQSTPDVILAHVAMPGISGYELCELIKQSERFCHIPVMLLVGLHEPFDQAEAHRVGADDIVAKPFKSIRELVGRVGSLLGGKAADPPAHEYSTLGLERSNAPQPAAPDNHTMTDTNLKVFIEAPSMNEREPIESAGEVAGSTCVADAELQTANTQKLERIDDERAPETEEPIGYAQDDTIEMAPARPSDEKLESPEDVGSDENMSSIGAPEMNEKSSPQAAPLQNATAFNDSLLDLGDFESPAQILVAEDLVLDLDYEEPASASVVAVAETIPEAALATEAASPADAFAHEPTQVAPEASYVAPEPTHEEQHVAELQEWTIVTETPVEAPVSVSVPEEQASTDPKPSLSNEAIDAIARRAVELMSDKVVREIAWEVVPELAELLIKKKLEEQSH
ncbi:MAG TPA: response regulator [Pyrinomonadaceae bacterium]|nr:response regulator [Pyrinomonadaceae bacterium]